VESTLKRKTAARNINGRVNIAVIALRTKEVALNKKAE